jgi:glycosyltransferase involved in cell wall biosynthesis
MGINERKRVGIFLDATPFSGGSFQYSQAVLEATSSLPKDRFEITVAYTNDFWNPSVRELEVPAFQIRLGIWRFLSSKRVCEYLPIYWWRSSGPSLSAAAKQVLRQRCHVWIFPAQETWTYLFPVHSLGTVFDLMHRYERRFKESSGYGLYRCRERHYLNMCRWSNGVFVDSEVGKQQVMESYRLNADCIHVLPFVPGRNIRMDWSPEVFKARYPLPVKFFFYPAQFWEHKNHKALVSAAALLKHEIPDLNLVFVGSEKNGYASTMELVQRLDLTRNIHSLGYVPEADMPGFYRSARALLMPTFYGPTNIPPLEAMALGCPVATSRIYGMPEQLGDAALFFDPKSVEQIARVMKSLWNDDDLCTELSRRGLLQASRWNQSHFNQRLLGIIERVLRNGWRTR